MELLLSLEHRFARTPDGAVWSSTSYGYPYWARYLAVFKTVRVLARCYEVDTSQDSWVRVDGPQVSLEAVPYYLGPAEYLRRYFTIRRSVRRRIRPGGAYLLRVPGLASEIARRRLAGWGYPFGVEVVGDPYDVFSPGGVQHPLRPFFRELFVRQLREQCRTATCSLYVTERVLQNRYPPRIGSVRVGQVDGCQGTLPPVTVGISDVELPDAAFTGSPEPRRSRAGRFRIVSVGTLEQLYKAQDVLITALAQVIANGLDAELVLIGDGRHRPMLAELARCLGIAERVTFCGHLPAGDAVRQQLDKADLFVLASRTEGLPRALIEAMARGLPCIGSTVGGIPELLEPRALVAPDDVEVLAGCIERFARDPHLLAEHSRANWTRARQYHEARLQARREEFYRALVDRTCTWLQSYGAPRSRAACGHTRRSAV